MKFNPNRHTLKLGRLVLLVASLLACSQDDDTASLPRTEPPVAAPGNPDEICPGACRTVARCELATVDIKGCEKQCKTELEGQGHLIPYVAKSFFELLRDYDQKSEYVCHAVYFDDVFELIHVTQDRDLFARCTNEMPRFAGGIPTDYDELCFFAFYRFNTPLRNKILPCFSPEVEGRLLRDCMETKMPTEALWIGGVEQYPKMGPF